MFSPYADTCTTSVTTLGHDTLTMEELRLLDLINKRPSVLCHNSVCRQTERLEEALHLFPILESAQSVRSYMV